jgi:alpha-galactosidase
MAKITFLGAGSTVFAKNVLGDSMLSDALSDAHIALYDIDADRLKESKMMLDNLNANTNHGRATITAHLGKDQRRAALAGANYVVNAIQVGGYKPSTVIDFEIPKKFGLRQTIGDTLGIGGIFRALRTIPVMLDFAHDMEKVCPSAWFLNYTNPMAMLTAAMLRGSSIKTVGLCHSVQGCAHGILAHLGMLPKIKKLQWKIAGINHQAWLLEITDGGRDLYPEIKSRALALLEAGRGKNGVKHFDMVRHYLMLQFGYYITESSEHSAEYLPYFIKSSYPELIKEFNIPIDEYPRRCVAQIQSWKLQARDLVHNKNLSHQRTHEYGSYIMEAMETDVPFRIGGNVMNTGLITNLPAKAAVEVSCLVDRNGVQPCVVGDLPEACAALNRTNINPQILTVEAALTRNRDLIYQAAMLDPHTSAELPIDQIRALCDALIEAHGPMLPRYAGTTIKPDRRVLDKKTIAPLWVAGPFDNRNKSGESLGLLNVLEPEQRVRLNAAYSGMKGKTVRWRKIARKAMRADGYVDLIELCGPHEMSVAYAYAEIRETAACRRHLHAGSDDGIAVWLNGKEILRVEASRGAVPGQDAAILNLHKGVNRLLLKIDNKAGNWGFYASLSGSAE